LQYDITPNFERNIFRGASETINVKYNKISKVGQLARQAEDIAKQRLDSLHDPNSDLAKFSEFDTSYIYDFDICVEINSAMPPIFISLAGTNSLLGINLLSGTNPLPYEETTTIVEKMYCFESVDDTFTYISCTGKICVDIDTCITTPVSFNKPKCIDITIATIFYTDPIDLQVDEILGPLPSTTQLPLMGIKPLFNQKALDTMKHFVKDHCAYHIDTKDENVFEFLGNFNFSNPTNCIDAEIDAFISSNYCYNSCRADFDTLEIIVPK